MKPNDRRILWFTLLLFTVVSFANAQETTIRIGRVGGKLAASPGWLALGTEPLKVRIESPFAIGCAMEGIAGRQATAGQQCRIASEVKSPQLRIWDEKAESDFVIIPLVPSGDSSGTTQLITLLLGLATLVGILATVFAVGIPGRLRQSQNQLAQLQTRMTKLAEVLEGIAAAGLSWAREPQKPRLDRQTPAPPPADDARDEARRFLKYLNEWTSLLTSVPSPSLVVEGYRNVEQMLEGSFVDRDQLTRIAAEIARVLVPATDAHLDPRFADEQLQAIVEQILETAGVILIHPGAGVRFDDRCHTVREREVTSRPQDRNKIARVIQRGMQRNGKVILKAEVAVYD